VCKGEGEGEGKTTYEEEKQHVLIVGILFRR